MEGYPYGRNINGIECTVIKTEDCPDLTLFGICRSPKIALSRVAALATILDENSSSQNIVMGDLNVNWLVESDRQSLYNLMVIENSYEQLISSLTTDNRTLIDLLFTNLIPAQIYAGILDTYFSDHKAIWASLKPKKWQANQRTHMTKTK